jgi:hypothetical protein
MDDNDLSIEKREPGLLASLFGAQPETVLVNSDGDVVGKIETEEPGFFGSLMGEEAKQVIVNEDGDKIASFEREEPGVLGSLMGEEAETILVDEDGEKLASFDKEEPGFIGKLLGDKDKTVLLDKDGDKLATFDREEPGIVGKLLGEKAKRLIRFNPERAEEMRRTLASEAEENGCSPSDLSPTGSDYAPSDLYPTESPCTAPERSGVAKQQHSLLEVYAREKKRLEKLAREKETGRVEEERPALTTRDIMTDKALRHQFLKMIREEMNDGELIERLYKHKLEAGDIHLLSTYMRDFERRIR